MEHANCEVLPALEDCVHEVISALAFHINDSHTVPLLKVLNTLLSRLKHWHPEVRCGYHGYYVVTMVTM